MANKQHVALLKQGTGVWNKWRKENPNVIPNLTWADFIGANLPWANLSKANLTWANLAWATLTWATLNGARLSLANLTGVNLSGANLSEADLSEADLSGANLDGANLTASRCYKTTFGNVDLSQVKGLETVNHLGPSTIGIDTIYRSNGNIPEVFLRGAGVPENFIAVMKSLTGQAVYSHGA